MKQLINVQTALRLLKRHDGIISLTVPGDSEPAVTINVIRYLEAFSAENLAKMCDDITARFYRTNIVKTDDAKALAAIALDELMQHVNGSK